MTQPERNREPNVDETPIAGHSPTEMTIEEIERRRLLFEEAMRLRDQLGPIGVSTAELIREDRDNSN